jgi:hypothetical protein
MVGGDKMPAMGYIYRTMQRAKNVIEETFDKKEENIERPSKSLIGGGNAS